MGWLDAVYHDQAIIIGTDEQGSTSSSSRPSVMAGMLDWLGVEDGDRVLEIGTGSGYNAALLCHRVRAANVTSIDNQEHLVTQARGRLESLGYRPFLAVADGAEGYVDRAQYDRVIGTAYAWPIPPAWVQQTRPGGRVVAVVPCGVVALEVRDHGSATGWYHPHTFSFMYMRGYMPEFPAETDVEARVAGRSEVRAWKYPPTILLAGHMAAFNLLVSATIPYEWFGLGPDTNIFDIVSGSWVRFERDAEQVVQGGPRKLWDEAEELFEQWCRLGAPNRERFGLTVAADGQHTLWLDEPDSAHCWDVTPTQVAAPP